MYMHEAMRQPDKEEFKKAMVKEVTDQLKRGVYKLIPIKDVPKGMKILPAVWQL